MGIRVKVKESEQEVCLIRIALVKKSSILAQNIDLAKNVILIKIITATIRSCHTPKLWLLESSLSTDENHFNVESSCEQAN